jgi:hypothetical protein
VDCDEGSEVETECLLARCCCTQRIRAPQRHPNDAHHLADAELAQRIRRACRCPKFGARSHLPTRICLRTQYRRSERALSGRQRGDCLHSGGGVWTALSEIGKAPRVRRLIHLIVEALVRGTLFGMVRSARFWREGGSGIGSS